MKCYYSTDDGTNWTQITDVVDFPTIKTALNKTSYCVIVIRSFHDTGTQFADWEGRDFANIKVEDESSNIIFRGYLENKIFENKILELHCKGLSARLDWKGFNKNYELAAGKVGQSPAHIAGVVEICRPDGDGMVQQWQKLGATDHWEDVDDTTPDNYAIYASDVDDGEKCEFTMTTISDVTSVQSVSVKIYGRNNATMGAADCYCNLYIEGVWQGQKTMSFTTTYTEYTSTWAGLNSSQAELNAMEIRVTANAAIIINEEQMIDQIYAEVIFTGIDTDSIELTDFDDVIFAWDINQWVTDTDCGLLIVDNTTGNTTTNWDASAYNSTNENDESGAAVDTNTAQDGNSYFIEETTTTWDANVVFTMDGAVMDSTTVFLKSLTINFRYKTVTDLPNNSFFKIEINKDGSYYTLETIPFTALTVWEDKVFIIEDTDTELAKYFDKTGNDYDELKGIRLTFYNPYAGNITGQIYIDLLEIDIEHNPYDIVPIMAQITANGASYVECDTLVFEETGISDRLDPAADSFRIGQDTKTILNNICEEASVGILITSAASFTKYSARWFKGTTCLDALKSIILLEGAYWYEDFTYDRIVIVKPADFEDSGVDLTQASYDHNWSYTDDGNNYKKVDIFGKASLLIYAFARDERATNTSPKVKIIVDETITTNSDAQDIADAQLVIYKDKRPSIKLMLKGVNSAIIAGKEVTITMVRPAVAEANYVVRSVVREKFGILDYRTTVLAGLGESSWDEHLLDSINKISHIAHKAHTDRLTSTPVGTGASISWSDIGGAENAVDALIATHTVDDDAHHAYKPDDMIGAANSALINLSFEIATAGTAVSGTHSINNAGAIDGWWLYKLPLPTNRGGLKLYIVDTVIELSDADVANCIDRVLVRAMRDDALLTHTDDAGDFNTIDTHVINDAAEDVSDYTSVIVTMLIKVGTANALECRGVMVECYYDT